MQRTKKEKGITLVALIITVVVLLILVSVAINSIQNDGILSYAGNVANKYNQAQKDEQSVLDSYLDYLKGDNDWVTIYDGEETTTDGELLLANEHLFTEGNSYRITVESNEFSGTVETVAVLYQEGNEYDLFEYYILFGVLDEKAITANSLEEYLELQQTFGENATVVLGMSATEGTQSISYMFFDTTCEYKVIKVEAKASELEKNTEEDDSLIFEGELVLEPSTQTNIPGLKREMSPTKTYRIEVVVDGVTESLNTASTIWDGGRAIMTANETQTLILMMDSTDAIASSACTITKIYEVGESETYVAENGFEACLEGTYGWRLGITPDTSYVVPETVGGKTIDSMDIHYWLKGTPTFVRTINLIGSDMPAEGKTFIIDTTDATVISSLLEGLTRLPTNSFIDLTRCGNDLTFSDEVLGYLTSSSNTLYVTEAVKAKYSDNAKIVVPESE